MQVVSLVLLYLGSVFFFGLEVAKLDLASNFKRKMQAMSLALLYLGSISFFGLEAAKLDLPSDFKRNLILEPVNLRSRRQARQASPALSHLNVVRLGCRLGTCHAHNLSHMIFHLTDKMKDCAPPKKVEEYGRRRRQDLEDTFAALFTRSLCTSPEPSH